MKKAKVSVLTPAYNAEGFIGLAIESILKQTYSDFEYIIIDDCSTDGTWKLIQKYSKKDKRIKIARNEKNLYIAGARNTLIKRASGKYIVWQDADDISEPNRIEHQFNYLEKHPEVGIVGGFLEFFDESGVKGLRKYAATDNELRKRIFRFSPVAQPAAMIRREVFEKVGIYDLRFPPAEDLDMSFRIGKFFKFANLQEVVIKYRETLTSATFTRLKKIEKTSIAIRYSYMNDPAYKVSFVDKVYNLLHYFSIFLIPPKLKIWLFNQIRNSK